MYRMLRKIAATPRLVVPEEELLGLPDEVIGQELQASIKKLFSGSLAIREVAAGSSNAEEQELTALTNAYYDVERFGVHFVASPRHADMIMVTGPISRNMAQGVRHTYEATPDPKIVVAVGDGAIDGGVYRGSYAIHDSLEEVIMVPEEGKYHLGGHRRCGVRMRPGRARRARGICGGAIGIGQPHSVCRPRKV